MKLRQHGILLLVCAVGLGVLGDVVIRNRLALTEWWCIFRLSSGDDGTRDWAIRWLKEKGSARAISALVDHAAARAGDREAALSALEVLLPRGSAAEQADASGKLLAMAKEECAGRWSPVFSRGWGLDLLAEAQKGAAGLLIRAAPGLPAMFPVLLGGARSGDSVLLGICARALCDAWPASRQELGEALHDASPEAALAFFDGTRRFTKQTSFCLDFPWAEPLADGPRRVVAYLAREHPEAEVRAVGLALALPTSRSQAGDAYDTDLLAECIAPSAPPLLRRAAVRLIAYLGNLPNVPDLGAVLLAEPEGSPLLVDLIQARDHQNGTSFRPYGVELFDGVRCDWIPSRGPWEPDAWTDAEVARLETILRTETDGSLRDAASAAVAGRNLPTWNPGSTDAPPAPTFEVHEWGVWKDGGDFLTVAEATLAELPPFVHRSSASTADVVNERSYSPSVVTKPILFFHSAEPLSVVVRVRFFEGRPWTYFPDATDELETPRYADPHITNFADRAGISPPWPLSKVPTRFFETAPWLVPRHRRFPNRGGRGPIELAGMGVEWRGLRVGYDAALEPPLPTADPSSWWKFLREVPACPVAVRGEREQFLFYDGSTSVPAPVVSAWSARGRMAIRLSIRPWDKYPTEEWVSWIERDGRTRIPRGPIKCVFAIRKVEGAPPRGTIRRDLSPNTAPEVVDLDTLDLEGDQLMDVFGDAIRAEGLSPEETRSLLRTWERDFFQKPGLRLVTFLPRWLYDVAVPLSIYPEPARVVRVALVVRELDSLR